jgi:hypothetical protein
MDTITYGIPSIFSILHHFRREVTMERGLYEEYLLKRVAGIVVMFLLLNSDPDGTSF